MNYTNKKKDNRFLSFLADKGFYIILILCISAIGISGYVLFFSEPADNALDRLSEFSPPPASERTPVPEIPLLEEIPDGAVRETEVIMSTPTPPAPSKAPDSETAESSGSDKTELGAVSAVGGSVSGVPKGDTSSFFVWPVSGQIVKAFSIDELVFSASMGDWRVHTGLDIGANRGTQVLAAADGKVEDIYTDELMGVTLVIDHGGELKSLYQNLAEKPTVAVGDRVLAGDVIGAVGDTAAAEAEDSPHLHLEFIRAGAQIDPLTLLPKS